MNSWEGEKEHPEHLRTLGVKWNWQSNSDIEFVQVSLELVSVPRYSMPQFKGEVCSFHCLLSTLVPTLSTHFPVDSGSHVMKQTVLYIFPKITCTNSRIFIDICTKMLMKISNSQKRILSKFPTIKEFLNKVQNIYIMPWILSLKVIS